MPVSLRRHHVTYQCNDEDHDKTGGQALQAALQTAGPVLLAGARGSEQGLEPCVTLGGETGNCEVHQTSPKKQVSHIQLSWKDNHGNGAT